MVSVGKDGIVHGVDTANKTEIYKTPATTIENADTPFTQQETRFCPGIQGGAEWNGPTFSPKPNLIFVNTIDWCSVVNLGTKKPSTGTHRQTLHGRSRRSRSIRQAGPPDRRQGLGHGRERRRRQRKMEVSIR